MPTVNDDKKVVVGTNSTGTASTTTTISDFEHPGGTLIVFHTIADGAITTERTVSLTFDGSSATKLDTAFLEAGGVQVDAFAIESAAETADIVATINTSHSRRSLFAVPVGAGVGVVRTGKNSVPVNNSVALSTSSTVDTATGNLVLQCARWRNSGTSVNSYATDQTQVLSDDSPTRCDLSKKSASGGSTTVTTTLDAASEGNAMASIAVVLEAVATVNTPANLNAEQITATSARLTWDYEA
jgi:hypothetical protein